MSIDFRDIAAQARAMQPQLTAWRRDFHRHPELAHEEFRTAEIIEKELESLGIPSKRVDGTGVVGILRGGKSGGHVVALRADIDALPVREESDKAYASLTDGVMHACGHDGHTACLLGAARLLVGKSNMFGGEVRFLFQPAEERAAGAIPMIKAGAVAGVERVFGLHAASDVPIGVIGLKPGLNNASVDHFTITVTGRASHVSTPHLGVDALYIACQIVVAAQALVTRLSSPVEPLILGIGKLNAGTTYNALAERAMLEGTTRAVTVEGRARIRSQLNETAANIAAIYGGTAEVEWEDFTCPLINDPQATAEASAVVEALYGPGHVKADRALSLAGDDFAEFQCKVPGTYAYLGTGNPNKHGTQAAHHSVDFDIDEDALPIGAALYAGYAISWLAQD